MAFRVRTSINTRAVEARIDGIQQRARNLRPWLDDLADKIADINRLNFMTNGSVVGGWRPLSPDYLRWKQRKKPGSPTLVFNARMMESLTRRPFGVEQIGRRSLRIGSDVHYAEFHQTGTRNMPARKVLVMPESLIKTMKHDLADYIVNGRLRS